MSLTSQLKKAIEASGISKYAIALGAKVDHAVLRRFMSGERDIKLSTAERLAEFLNLELKNKSKKPKL
mgnify:CR=1 FL=1